MRIQSAEKFQSSLYKNKVTAFIGPSGCGKSTLLRIINRCTTLTRISAPRAMSRSTAGYLSPKQDLNLLRARIGMVFQKPKPFPMSIYENVAFGCGSYREARKAELDERVECRCARAALWDEVKDG